ncbi:MAG: HAMP domain-containing histidine kinase [Peptococcaceae bacterium]|jgi:signal transduction histidine kinase|nr:HAMP domain-containing histidine kinase [Peptococcaceae bacterium]
MKRTMRRKLLMFMAGVISLVVCVGWLVNSLFLERFYLYSKADSLRKSLATINNLYNSGNPDLQLELERMMLNQGIQVAIFTRNLDAVLFAWQDIVRLGPRQILITGVPGLRDFIAAGDNRRQRFEISRNFDDRLKSEYLDLVGELDNGLYALLRVPVQTITDSVGIANRFLLITGIFSILATISIGARLSNQIAKPIKAVEGIARSMACLDFSQRIRVESEDEIGSLASSINVLSDYLQKTIQELRQKNQQLEDDILYISRLDEIRKEFLSNVSHELKTPIALIQGYAEALEEKVVTSDEDRDYYYHVISDEADKMNSLVRKLMNLNNLEAGHDDLFLDSFDIVSMASSVLRRGESLAGAPGLDFQLAAPTAAWVWADEFLIEEVMFNYLTNAIHYASGRNIVRIQISSWPDWEDRGGPAAKMADPLTADEIGNPAAVAPAPTPGSNPDRRVRVAVFNSGSSLAPEEQERVWDSFYKTDTSRSREYGGSGLGLAVVRATMERHQSGYGVENLEDGVSFWFDLPAAEPPSDD